jgi:hypothetical protein
VRVLERPQLEHRVAEREPVARDRERGGVRHQAQDDPEGLVHHVAEPVGLQPEHHRVGDVPPGPDAEVHAPAGQVVEQHDAVGDHQGVVVRQAHRPGPQPDVPRALGRDGQEQLRGGDGLPARAVVLADPCLVEAEPVAERDQLQIALEGECGVLPLGMEGGDEDAELQGKARDHAGQSRPVRTAGSSMTRG